MLFSAQSIPYQLTGQFSKIVTDYLDGAEALKNFYAHPPTLEGIKEAIEKKSTQIINRPLLVAELQKQYGAEIATEAVKQNIELLRSEKTFTVCTAHQPNLFTGPLYFIYKILHAIKLAAYLKEQLPAYDFVPVYYMGSEDADFAELNHTYVNGQLIEWKREQTGAVGRMTVDKSLIKLIDELEGQLSIQKNGPQTIDLLRRCYTEGKTIQMAAFELVNELYGEYGLIVSIPDNAAFKKSMIPVFEDDLFNQTSSVIVEQTSIQLEEQYKAQAHPRAINLFYLKDAIRERIVQQGENFVVQKTELIFTREELQAELQQHPERFSPNVILRGLYQEIILPNIAFIGGGGELAYWLQLKNLFEHYGVPYPMLVLRNSFLIIEQEWLQRIKKLHLSNGQLFKSELDLLNAIIEEEGNRPRLNGELDEVEKVYQYLSEKATAIDVTLSQHVAALKTKTIKELQNLEKKMFRAERKKHEAVRNQIAKLKQQLFPNDSLQERIENFSGFYAQWGKEFIDALYESSFALEQQFVILTETV